MMLVVACSDTTKPVDPAKVASLTVTPAIVPVVRGAQVQLSLTASDSGGNDLGYVQATWASNTPSIVTVSNDGRVTGIDYGATSVTATIGSHTVLANVVVTSTPTTKTYAVTDLGSNLVIASIARQLSDSGDVLVGQSSTLYRHGALTNMVGCSHAVAINGPGHVLCKVDATDSISSYAIWRDGGLASLAAADTFSAQHFRAFAISDSDEVAGLFFMPTFVNDKCPVTGVRCLSIWRNGMPSFPGFDAGGSDVMLMNNERQVVVEYAMWTPNYGLSTTIYDIPTAKARSVPYGAEAFNDNGWAAIASPFLVNGSSDPLRSTAYVATVSSVVLLGNGGATGINNSNVVVGTLDIGPFIWRGNGVSLLTNASTDPAWTITAASEINNRGQILAIADNADGRRAHAVILTPTQP
jgi:hypothetical protein